MRRMKTRVLSCRYKTPFQSAWLKDMGTFSILCSFGCCLITNIFLYLALLIWAFMWMITSKLSCFVVAGTPCPSTLSPSMSFSQSFSYSPCQPAHDLWASSPVSHFAASMYSMLEVATILSIVTLCSMVSAITFQPSLVHAPVIVCEGTCSPTPNFNGM